MPCVFHYRLRYHNYSQQPTDPENNNRPKDETLWLLLLIFDDKNSFYNLCAKALKQIDK